MRQKKGEGAGEKLNIERKGEPIFMRNSTTIGKQTD
jgi:hypothetical protein